MSFTCTQNTLLSTMKSESDFQDTESYHKYLKYYYTGQILQGLVVSADNNLFTRQAMAEKVDKALGS